MEVFKQPNRSFSNLCVEQNEFIIESSIGADIIVGSSVFGRHQIERLENSLGKIERDRNETEKYTNDYRVSTIRKSQSQVFYSQSQIHLN